MNVVVRMADGNRELFSGDGVTFWKAEDGDLVVGRGTGQGEDQLGMFAAGHWVAVALTEPKLAATSR